jgi:hypothetical protein
MTATNATEPAADGGSGPVRLMGRDPQLPQLFEQLTEPLVIRPGDKLRATCVFDTTGVGLYKLNSVYP